MRCGDDARREPDSSDRSGWNTPACSGGRRRSGIAVPLRALCCFDLHTPVWRRPWAQGFNLTISGPEGIHRGAHCVQALPTRILFKSAPVPTSTPLSIAPPYTTISTECLPCCLHKRLSTDLAFRNTLGLRHLEKFPLCSLPMHKLATICKE